MKISYYLGTAIFCLTLSSLTQASEILEIKEIEEDDKVDEKLAQSTVAESPLRNVPSDQEINELLNYIFPCAKFNNSKHEQDDRDFEMIEHGTDDNDGYFVVGASHSSIINNTQQSHALNIRKTHPFPVFFTCQPMIHSLGFLFGKHCHMNIDDQGMKEEKS